LNRVGEKRVEGSFPGGNPPFDPVTSELATNTKLSQLLSTQKNETLPAKQRSSRSNQIYRHQFVEHGRRTIADQRSAAESGLAFRRERRESFGLIGLPALSDRSA
jgi:hypothetical protein